MLRFIISYQVAVKSIPRRRGRGDAVVWYNTSRSRWRSQQR